MKSAVDLEKKNFRPRAYDFHRDFKNYVECISDSPKNDGPGNKLIFTFDPSRGVEHMKSIGKNFLREIDFGDQPSVRSI